MKFLAGLLAFISSFFAGDSPKSQPPLLLNTAIIAFHETYFAPAVAEPGNFPWAKKIVINVTSPIPTPPPAPILPSVPAPIAPPPPPPPPTAPSPDQYLANPEPIVDWYVPVIMRGDSINNSSSTLPEMTFDREFWRMEIFAYWAPGVLPPRPPLEKDYFKLEVYDEGAGSKLIYTMTSGDEENIHKSQIFKKAGKYTFKAFAKTNGKYEINFFVSPKIAQ